MANLFESEFGGQTAVYEAAGVREAPVSAAKPKATDPPPKADAAPKTKTAKVFVGLCDALNQFQQNLVNDGTYEFADEYVIEFAPETMAQASLEIKGTADLKSTPTQNAQTPKDQLDPQTNAVDNTARTIAAPAGMPIVKFIDQVLRQSSYVTDQATKTIDAVEGTTKENASSGAAALAWYRISVKTEQISDTIDTKRNAYPMRMTYLVTPYAINQMQSQYFPDAKPRGSHKSYGYWFTGKNNAVLSFEQEYKNTYFQILTQSTDGKFTGALADKAGLTNQRAATESTSTVTKSFAGGTGQSDQGASNKANQIGASAADFLYGAGAPAEITLKIIGDPAWMQQGELSNVLTKDNFSFGPFNPDGTINFEASEIKFDIFWNRPTDYNYDTGLVDVNAQTRNPNGTLAILQPQAHLTYVAKKVKSTFSQGQFTQEIQGNWYANLFDEVSAENLKTAENQRASLVDRGLQLARTGFGGGDSGADTFENTILGDPTPATDFNVGAISNASTQAQNPDQPPTSNGETVASNPIATALASGRITSSQADLLGLTTNNGSNPQQMAPGDDS
jgi:hypothetical protein